MLKVPRWVVAQQEMPYPAYYRLVVRVDMLPSNSEDVKNSRSWEFLSELALFSSARIIIVVTSKVENIFLVRHCSDLTQSKSIPKWTFNTFE